MAVTLTLAESSGGDWESAREPLGDWLVAGSCPGFIQLKDLPVQQSLMEESVWSLTPWSCRIRSVCEFTAWKHTFPNNRKTFPRCGRNKTMETYFCIQTCASIYSLSAAERHKETTSKNRIRWRPKGLCHCTWQVNNTAWEESPEKTLRSDSCGAEAKLAAPTLFLYFLISFYSSCSSTWHTPDSHTHSVYSYISSESWRNQ